MEIVNKLTKAELQEFLTTPPRTGKLATVRADGRPHVMPIWFDLDGDDVVFMTLAKSVKARNILRDPRVAICVDDDGNPSITATVEGVAQVSEDLADLRYWAARIGGKYRGQDKAEFYGERNGVPGEMVVRVTPTNIFSRKGEAS